MIVDKIIPDGVGDFLGNAPDKVKNIFRKDKSTCSQCGKEIFEENKGICSVCRTKNNLAGRKVKNGIGKTIDGIGAVALFLLAQGGSSNDGDGGGEV